MAGNTKLVGFLDNHRIQLERWGVKVAVSLDTGSAEAIRTACFYELPKKPNQRPSTHLESFVCAYDQDRGRVGLNLDPETASYLADLLEVLVKNDVNAMDKVRPWIEKLRGSVQAHTDYHSGKDEPGAAQ